MAIARIDLSGKISYASATSMCGTLDYVRAKSKYRAAMIVINSGGGDASSSQMIYDAIRKIDEIKPVYAVILGMGASGAYWAATGARKIYAMATSTVGSIGVISINPKVAGLMEKLGISVRVTKVGRYKDYMSPFSKDEEGIENFQELLEDVYEIFIGEVMKRRNIQESMRDIIGTGEVFSARKAKELNLIDAIGSFQEAVDDLAADYGVSKKVRNISPRKPLITRMVGLALSEVMDRF